jgi:hypothetical protein
MLASHKKQHGHPPAEEPTDTTQQQQMCRPSHEAPARSVSATIMNNRPGRVKSERVERVESHDPRIPWCYTGRLHRHQQSQGSKRAFLHFSLLSHQQQDCTWNRNKTAKGLG